MRRIALAASSFWISFAAVCIGFQSPSASQEMRWEPPPELFEIDFGAKDAKTKPVFLKGGMAYEGVLQFPLIQRSKVVVNAKLPGPGEFTAVLVGDAEYIEVKQTTPHSCEVVSKRSLPSAAALIEQADESAFSKLAKQRDDAAKEAAKRKKEELEGYLRQKHADAPSGDDALRAAYIRRRTIELGESTIRSELASLAKKYPQWASKPEQERWQTVDELDAYQTLVRLLSLPPACEMLRAYGFEIDDKRPGSDRLIEAKLMGLSALASPVDSAKASAGALRGLTQSEITRIKQGLTVRLQCRYRPSTDTDDRNSQWFAAQRVRAGGRGIAAVRLEGSLDGSKHDSCDWWTIAEFDPERYSLAPVDDHGDWSHEVTQVEAGVARLRVTTKSGAPCKYTLELRPTTPIANGRTIVAREAAPASVDHFPF